MNKNRNSKKIMSLTALGLIGVSLLVPLNLNAEEVQVADYFKGYDYSDMTTDYVNSSIEVYPQANFNTVSLGVDAPDADSLTAGDVVFDGTKFDDNTVAVNPSESNTFEFDDEAGFMNLSNNQNQGYDLYSSGEQEFKLAYLLHDNIGIGREDYPEVNSGKILMWIDFNGDGKFTSDEGQEQVVDPYNEEDANTTYQIDYLTNLRTVSFNFDMSKLSAEKTYIKLVMTTDTSITSSDGDLAQYPGFGEVESYELNNLGTEGTNQSALVADEVIKDDYTITYKGVTEPETNQKIDVVVEAHNYEAESVNKVPAASASGDDVIYSTNIVSNTPSTLKWSEGSEPGYISFNVYESGTNTPYDTNLTLKTLVNKSNSQSSNIGPDGYNLIDYKVSPAPTNFVSEADSEYELQENGFILDNPELSNKSLFSNTVFSGSTFELSFADTSNFEIQADHGDLDYNLAMQYQLLFTANETDELIDNAVINASDINTTVSQAPTSKDLLFTNAGVSAVDNGSDVLEQLNVELDGYDYTNPQVGTYEITLTYTGINSQSVSTSFTLNVSADLEDAVITSNNYEVAVSNAPSDQVDLLRGASVVASDNGDNVINYLNVELGNYDYTNPQVGTYPITLTYTGTNGQSVSSSFTLTVVADEVAPDAVISASDFQTSLALAPRNDSELISGAAISANDDGIDLTNSISIELGDYDYTNPQTGTYTISASVTGANGNVVSTNFVLTVVADEDTLTDITISASDVSVELYEAPESEHSLLNLAKAQTSEYDGITNINVVGTDSYDYAYPEVGTYTILVSAIGENGNTASTSFELEIKENETESIDIDGNASTSDSSDTEESPTITDAKSSIADTGLTKFFLVPGMALVAYAIYLVRNRLYKK